MTTNRRVGSKRVFKIRVEGLGRSRNRETHSMATAAGAKRERSDISGEVGEGKEEDGRPVKRGRTVLTRASAAAMAPYWALLILSPSTLFQCAALMVDLRGPRLDSAKWEPTQGRREKRRGLRRPELRPKGLRYRVGEEEEGFIDSRVKRAMRTKAIALCRRGATGSPPDCSFPSSLPDPAAAGSADSWLSFFSSS